MKKIYLFFIIPFLVLIQACTPTTSLINITEEYRPVSPEKSRLLVKYDLPNEDIPLVRVKVYKDYFSQKVYTKHYETLRNDIKGNRVVLGLALSGLAGGLIALGSGMEEKDSTLKTLTILGGVLAGLVGIGSIISETPKEKFTEDSVDFADTLYAFQETVRERSLSLQNEHDKRIIQSKTNSEGILTIDVRDFYNNLPENIPLKILISDGIAKPQSININEKYIQRIRNNESQADKLYKEAEAKVKAKKFSEANSLFEKIIEKYPLTKSAENSKAYIKRIEGNVKEERLELIRKKLRAVSVNKVPEAMDKAGISASELNEIGYRIDRLSRSKIVTILIDGLGMPIDSYQAEHEFYELNNSQKIYAIISASEKISKEQGKQKWEVISSILGIYESIAKKLARIESGKLLER